MSLRITVENQEALTNVLRASKEVQKAVLQAAGAMARANWINAANKQLSTSKRSYVMGIQKMVLSRNSATISLVGALPNLIENGMPRIDMHDTLLGPNVPVVPLGKRGKHLIQHGPKAGGFFRAIPFRHATPGTTGAVGAEMGSQFAKVMDKSEWKAMGAEIYAAARELSATRGKPFGKRAMRYGDRLDAGMAPKLRDHHATDIFAGMIRSEKTYEKATQSQYTTFRTISTGSPGWIRPATPGIHLAKQVQKQVEAALPAIVAAIVSQFKGGLP